MRKSRRRCAQRTIDIAVAQRLVALAQAERGERGDPRPWRGRRIRRARQQAHRRERVVARELDARGVDRQRGGKRVVEARDSGRGARLAAARRLRHRSTRAPARRVRARPSAPRRASPTIAAAVVESAQAQIFRVHAAERDIAPLESRALLLQHEYGAALPAPRQCSRSSLAIDREARDDAARRLAPGQRETIDRAIESRSRRRSQSRSLVRCRLPARPRRCGAAARPRRDRSRGADRSPQSSSPMRAPRAPAASTLLLARRRNGLDRDARKRHRLAVGVEDLEIAKVRRPAPSDTRPA